MKRRDFLKAAGAAAAVAGVAAPAIAQSSPEIRWRLTASWPKSLDALFGCCELFAKRLSEITDNRFKVQVFAAGEIVPGLQVLDAVQNGAVEMGHTPAYYYWGKDPAFAFTSAIPFGLNTRQYEAWLLHGGGSDMLSELFANYNCWGIPMANSTAQMGGWFRREIKTLDDLKGLKFRIGGFAGKVVGRLGVVPQQLAPGDIYPALEKGTLDAVEWIGPYDDERLGFVRVAKYYYAPGWWEGSANAHLLVNLEAWRKLPTSYQAAVTAAAREAGGWTIAKYDYQNPAAIKRLVAAGAELRLFPQEIMEAGLRATQETCNEIGETNPRFKQLYDSMTAFRDDAYNWWQICELQFDAFQVRMRRKT